MSSRQEKLNKELRKVCSEFIERESNRTSLITVTRTELSPDGKTLDVLVSVLPIEKEESVIEFLNRRKKDMRDMIKKRIATRVIPFVTFRVDDGEKNRQEIDRLLKDV